MPIGAETQTFSSISALLSALTLVLLGAVLLSRSRRPAYRAFIVLCGNVLLWHLFNIFRGGDRSSYLALSAQIALPLTLVGFLRTWLSSGRDLGSEPRRSVGAPRYALFIVLLSEVALVYAYSTRESSSPPAPTRFWVLQLPSVLRVATLFALYGALSPLWTAYRSTLSRVDKRRLLYLIGVGALSITAAALDYLPSPLGRGGPAIGSLLTIVYLYFLQQTLVMDRLLDINELLGRVVVLSAFVLLLSAVQTVLTLIGVQPQQVVTVVAFLILLLYEPLRIVLERQVQRITTRERTELQQSLGELRQLLPNVIEPREAVRLVLAVFEETRRLTQAAIYLLEADGSGYELSGSFGSSRPVERLDAAARRPFWSRLIENRQPITLERLQYEQGQLGHSDAAAIENVDAIARVLVEVQASAVVGIFGGGLGSPSAGVSSPGRASADFGSPEVLLGFLCIKDKDPSERLNDSFSVGDLDIYAGIAAQLSITLQNSKLYDRMKERDRLAALGQMAAGLAHEIRNPLGAIKGAAELIAPDRNGRLPSNEDVAEFSGVILEETRRLGRVVSQFLDYARPLRGDYQPIDINDVVRRTEALLRPLSEQMKNDSDPGWQPPEIVMQLSPDLPRTRGDAEQLRQVFLNLGLNALQAMADAHNATSTSPAGSETEIPRGRLSISTGLRHGGRLGGPTQHIEVRFSDTGPGLDPAVQKNLFIPFFTTKERGTGLGLAISQRIIENHDGFIEVRTRTAGPPNNSGTLPTIALSPSGAPGAIAPMTGSSTTGSTPIASSGTTFLVVLPVSAE
ncbi:MAG TPA: ATP-binding protein [Pseudomonadota bacterium]|nr:ATP-binding protein [Pseudomonadota bacterium]